MFSCDCRVTNEIHHHHHSRRENGTRYWILVHGSNMDRHLKWGPQAQRVDRGWFGSGSGQAVVQCSQGPLNACMEPSDRSPLFHAQNGWEPSNFHPNLGLKTPWKPLEPSNFSPRFQPQAVRICMNLAILTPIGSVPALKYFNLMYTYSLHNSNHKIDANERNSCDIKMVI